VRARALVERELVRLETDPDTAQPVPDRDWAALRGDDGGECRAWLLRGQLEWYAGQAAAADAAWATAGTHADRAGLRRDLFEVIAWRATAAAIGPAPVDAAIRQVDGLRELVRASPLATASALNPLAHLHAMRGDLDTAEALLAQAREILHDLGGLGSAVSHLEAIVRLLAGQPERAEALLRDDAELLSAMSEGAALATTTALLAQAVLAQGRAQEAGELASEADRRASLRDVQTQAIWRGVRARALALEGHGERAAALAREAVGMLEPTDLLCHRGDAMLDLAVVLGMSGHREESERAARAAVALYERKGNAVAAARVQPVLRRRQGGS
jgi:ATP/maltotriose-dependent transcriptional regulator MalT